MIVGNKPVRILKQPGSTQETRAVTHAALVLDIPVETVAMGGLGERAAELRTGKVLPVGSVEYVREAMRVAGLAEPSWTPYPEALTGLLHRKVRRVSAGNVLGRWFVKPVEIKTFNGFVFDTMQDPDGLDEHDREQYDIFMNLDASTQVLTSEVVSWASEHRIYVMQGQIVGRARYDAEGAEDAAPLDEGVLKEAVALMRAAYGAGVTCAIDLGVLSTGETALVEVNDAWSLGMYRWGIEQKPYLAMLADRWEQIAKGGVEKVYACAGCIGDCE